MPRHGAKAGRGSPVKRRRKQYEYSSSDESYSDPPSYSDDSRDESETDSDLDRDRHRLVPPVSKSPSRTSRSTSRPPPPDSQLPGLSTASVVLYLGIAFILCLALLSAFAIYKYTTAGEAELSDSDSVRTITETVGGKTVTIVSTSRGTATKSASGSAPSGTGSSANGSVHTTFPGLSKNGIGIGFLPDYKDQTLMDINNGLGVKSSFLGWYAQLPETGEWDGSQLLSELDDVVESGAIFQPAIMPNKNNWDGLTLEDDYQAQAIARVLEQFTSKGVETWVRFAHEINWYLTDGTYSGGVEDFKAGWAAVANAVKDNPLVKMFFTPNIAASLDDYTRFFPDDKSTVHIIGIDYYPKSSSESFLEHMQPFYDAYCKDGSILFAMGETGTMWDATIEEKLAWMDQMTSAETAAAMPNYVGTSIFNYNKETTFELFRAGKDADNAVAKAWFANGTVAEGGKMGGGG